MFHPKLPELAKIGQGWKNSVDGLLTKVLSDYLLKKCIPRIFSKANIHNTLNIIYSSKRNVGSW